MESHECKNSSSEIQEARSCLRERFLKSISSLSTTQESEIVMHENTMVKGKLRAFDSECGNVVVEDLQTPSVPVKMAILRSSDIISIHLKNMPRETFNYSNSS